MFFSIVIPLYNKEKSIGNTLKSVLNQTITDFEVIVVNDGSTDNSANVVTEFAKQDRRIRLVNKPNGGVCSARNRGIQEAKHEYIALLDGDDIWDVHYLEEQTKMIQDFPKANMWGINFAEIENEKLTRKLETGLPNGYRGYVENYFEMKGRISDLFCSSSVVIRKSAFEKAGMFDERLKYSEDTDMWWRIIALYNVAFFDKYLVFYCLDAENRTTHRKILLRNDGPFVVDKYQDKIWKKNKTFYIWINRHSAQWIAKYLFTDKEQINDAYIASKKLDYSVIPFKYRILFKTPYWFGKFVYNTIAAIK
jgi:glycosyltransferase involved in cell wall biosynthesis